LTIQACYMTELNETNTAVDNTSFNMTELNEINTVVDSTSMQYDRT